jgi:predicted transposase/invertase (TIGR01784 family)
VKTDSIFYQIFAEFPSSFFELISRPTNEAQGYQFRSVEIKQVAFRIDGVFLPLQKTPIQTVYFVEIQFQKDQLLYHRVFAKLFLFFNQNPTRLAYCNYLPKA